MKTNLSVNIGKLKLKNPVMVASGTFGYAEEFKDFIDLKSLGAVVTKTITLAARKGNPAPRTCETPCGMLNSIGLDNPGWETFVKEKLTSLKKLAVPIIVSIASETGAGEFVELARRIDRIKEIAAIELNISCPNIHKVHGSCLPAGKAGFIVHGKEIETQLIAQDPVSTYKVVKAVRAVTNKTLITKLSPNVTSISDIASAAESAGSDAVSLINTITGMCINTQTRKPKLGAVTGGLSGPAVRPVALRMVWQVYKKIKLPIIGMGGIIDSQSALEFFIAGSSAISIGTANFVNPKSTIEILKGLEGYLIKHNLKDINQLIGSLNL